MTTHAQNARAQNTHAETQNMEQAPVDFSFDIDEIPFSYRGSWLDLSRVVGLHERADGIRLVSHTSGMHSVLALTPQRADAAVEAAITATPAVLSWHDGDGRVRAAFDGVRTLRIAGDGLGMSFTAQQELTPFTGAYLFVDPVDGATVLTSYGTGRRYRFTMLKGEAAVAGAEETATGIRSVTFSAAAPWEVAIEEYETGLRAYSAEADFDGIAHRVADEFHRYAAALTRNRLQALAATKAAYVMWSATVRPSGFVGREAILMSKHWMDKVWSWDHCFNAIALAAVDARAAIDQFLLPFDHQDAAGALPDSVTHSEVLYNFVKPPIHGWAFAQLRARTTRAITQDELRLVYERLSAWTQFWLNSRRVRGHTLPYYQHGNDSGWDNSTTFDASRVIESPDLAAFLILQLDELAWLADQLGDPQQSWRSIADQVLQALLGELWDTDVFVARDATTGTPSSSTSLLNALPIVLADRLPPEVAAALAQKIERHLTPWGPATEPVGSPLYTADGYWRGPVWAPSTFLIEDGLRRAGFTDLADRVSASFRAVCERSGFAENFDAQTGAGLRDRAYTWTASCYLVLSTDADRRSRGADADAGDQARSGTDSGTDSGTHADTAGEE